MKLKKLLSIICVIIVIVLVATSLTACGGVDKEYEYNTEIITNENAPKAGVPYINNISGYTEDKDQKFAKLPYSINETPLNVVSIGKYSGINPEMGYTEAQDIFAIVVKNNSDKVVSFSSIDIEYADEKSVQFVPTNIPANCSALVFTEGAMVDYKDVEKFECTDAMSVLADELTVIDKVGIDFKDGEFILTNLTNENLGDVYIRFKKFVEGNAYLGGKTYSVRIENVEPYETYKLKNTDFDPDTSIIISVESVIPATK